MLSPVATLGRFVVAAAVCTHQAPATRRNWGSLIGRHSAFASFVVDGPAAVSYGDRLSDERWEDRGVDVAAARWNSPVVLAEIPHLGGV